MRGNNIWNNSLHFQPIKVFVVCPNLHMTSMPTSYGGSNGVYWSYTPATRTYVKTWEAKYVDWWREAPEPGGQPVWMKVIWECFEVPQTMERNKVCFMEVWVWRPAEAHE